MDEGKDTSCQRTNATISNSRNSYNDVFVLLKDILSLVFVYKDLLKKFVFDVVFNSLTNERKSKEINANQTQLNTRVM